MRVPLTIPTVAARYGVPVWLLRRLYDRGAFPAPPRVGLYRIIDPDDLPAVEAALRAAGYLREKEVFPCA
jgi:hypothetical protein